MSKQSEYPSGCFWLTKSIVVFSGCVGHVVFKQLRRCWLVPTSPVGLISLRHHRSSHASLEIYLCVLCIGLCIMDCVSAREHWITTYCNGTCPYSCVQVSRRPTTPQIHPFHTPIYNIPTMCDTPNTLKLTWTISKAYDILTLGQVMVVWDCHDHCLHPQSDP